MKNNILYAILGLFCLLLFLFLTPKTIFAQAKPQEIIKLLNITDQQISGRILQACDEYDAKIAEANKQTDEMQRNIKKLRANQNYATKVKSVLMPEQKLKFDNFNKKEQNSFIKKTKSAQNTPKTKVKKTDTKEKVKTSTKIKLANKTIN